MKKERTIASSSFLKLMLFLIGSIFFLIGLQYFAWPVRVIRTQDVYEVYYDYETGTILVVPGLAMIIISIIWAIKNAGYYGDYG